MAFLSRASRTMSSIEPLEARIAPALLINGANLLTANTANATGETSIGDNAVTVVKITQGQAIVWYQDGDILGISVGPNTGLEVNGSIYGDVIGNLTEFGRLSDSDGDPSNGEDGAVLLANNLLSFKLSPVGGEQVKMGNIVTGGSISNVKIDGQISGIYAGDGAFQTGSAVEGSDLVRHFENGDESIDFNPVLEGVQSSFEFSLASSKTDASKGIKGLAGGASIQNVEIAKGEKLQIFAGNGDPNGTGSAAKNGVAGGSIRHVTIDTAFTVPPADPTDPAADPVEPETGTASYHLRAGSGGSGRKGGAGGSIDHIIETNSSGIVEIEAGAGGNGSARAGGAGGSISYLDLQSNSTQYNVHAGDGGTGAPGGAGGGLLNNNFANKAPVGGVIVAADFTGDGVDDVLVADPGTGDMELSENVDDGASFQKVVQHTEGNSPVYAIKGKDTTPSDAVAVDFDNDGDLDLIVAYKNSNSVGVFLNDGHGSFWDAKLKDGKGDFTGFSVDVGLSPSRLAVMGDDGSRIAVAGLVDGKGAVQLLKRSFADGARTLGLESGINNFSLPIADLVASSSSTLFLATGDGTIERLTLSGAKEQPFAVNETGVSVSGGISDLDIDSTGTRLLALSTSTKTLNVYDIRTDVTGTVLSEPIGVSLGSNSGVPLIAKFIDDGIPDTNDQIAVLNSVGSGSRVQLFVEQIDGTDSTTSEFVLSNSLDSTQSLKNFVPVYSDSGPASFAAISGSLNKFTFGDDFLKLAEYSLDFSDKTVAIVAGNGGAGKDLGTLFGKGGAGGNVVGINAAHTVIVTAGSGGDAEHGAGGNGGLVRNPAQFTSASGLSISPSITADGEIVITAGQGGTPAFAGDKTTAGGAGGSISNLNLDLANSNAITLTAGNGGTGKGGAGGAGGGISSIVSATHGGSLFATAGSGGASIVGTSNTSRAGGAGGSITGLSHISDLTGEAESLEVPIDIFLTSGAGGQSVNLAGGAGGNLSKISLKIDAADTTDDPTGTLPVDDTGNISTVTIALTAGAGAQGAKGGFGGSINDLRYESVLDQEYKHFAFFNSFVMSLTAGDGGKGTVTDGGYGGSITLKSPVSGISFYDPDEVPPADNPDSIPLIVTAGNGGDGEMKGGAGGSISGLVAQNAPFSDGRIIAGTLLSGAQIHAGNGGMGSQSDGGRGGNISKSVVGVLGKYLDVKAGNGGQGGAKGGAGGAITGGEFGVVSTDPTAFNLGMLLSGGAGGDGVASGGAGGAISNVRLNTSQSTDVPSALVIAGRGGDANSVSGAAGNGGDIFGLTQTKDINSSINLIQAGNGGDNLLGKAGVGGSVSHVQTVGFIGRPSDGGDPLGIFDSIKLTIGEVTLGGPEVPTELFHAQDKQLDFAQGLFVGRGGLGQSGKAANGSVLDVNARQIAAIAAAMDPATQLFDAVTKIAQVRADLIGFDADRGTGSAGDGVFNDVNSGTDSPQTVIPRDGFRLAVAEFQVSEKVDRPTFDLAPVV